MISATVFTTYLDYNILPSMNLDIPMIYEIFANFVNPNLMAPNLIWVCTVLSCFSSAVFM